MIGERKIRPSEVRAMAKKAEKAAEAAKWEDYSDELSDIPELAKEFKELKEGVALAEERCKEIAPILEAAVLITDRKSLICPDFKITRVPHPGNPVFHPEPLVEKLSGFGLKPEQIVEAVQCCVTRTPYTYPLVTRIGEPDVV